MFGLIFQGGGESRLNLAWVDSDGSPQSAELRAALAAASGVDVEDTPRPRRSRRCGSAKSTP